MKSHIYRLIGFLVICSTFWGCTYADFPVSFDSVLPDRRMEGIWTADGADYVYEIKVLQDGKVYALRHTFDKQKQKLVREPQYPRLYFYNILTSDSKKYSFASFMNGGKYYSTVNYSFINNDAVRLLEVQYSAAKDRYQEKDGYYKFGTMENHRKYITDNLLNPGNYSSESVLKRVTDLSALEYKIGQELKKAEQLAAQAQKEAVKKPELAATNYPPKKPETFNSPSSAPQQQESSSLQAQQLYSLDELFLLGTVSLGTMVGKGKGESLLKELLYEKGFTHWFTQPPMYGFRKGDDYCFTIDTESFNIRITTFKYKVALFYLREIQKYFEITSIRPIHENHKVLRSHTKPYILEEMTIKEPFSFNFIFEEPFRYPSLR